jgi:uncharacterized protein involved in exopolysaccharide biosynthesis
MTEQPLNLRFVLSSVRRHRVVFLISLILGLGVGTIYGIVRPLEHQRAIRPPKS